MPEPVIELERVGGSRNGGRARALGATGAVVAVLVLVVAVGLTGEPGAAPGSPSMAPTTASRSPAETGASIRRSNAPSPPDLSFTLPDGLLVVDETRRALPSASGGTVSAQFAELTGGSHYAIVGRCVGPGIVGWEIGPDESGVTQSGEVACDGTAHGTGIVTPSGRDLPIRLSYAIAADFRIVVALIP